MTPTRTLRACARWAACAAGLAARCLLLAAVLAAARGASGSDIAVAVAPESAEIAIRADEANRWNEGAYEVWVLHGDCRISQGPVTARAQAAVLWVDRAEPLSGRTSKVLAYLEGDVSVDYGRSGPVHRQTGRRADSIRDRQWLGRFYSTTDIQIDALTTGFAPRVKPAIFFRGQEARQREVRPSIRQAQYTAPPSAAATPPAAPGAVVWPTAPPTAPGSGLPVGPGPMPAREAIPPPVPAAPPTARRLLIQSRSNVRLQAKVFPSPDGKETIAVITSGVKVIVEGIQNTGPVTGDMIGDKIDVETDRIVIWTAPIASLELAGQSSGQRLQPQDAPLEFYMEGNIVFREGDRVIYAERMYYNVRDRYGIVLNAEVLTPAPGYQGLVRLKADVLQQLDEANFRAFGAAVTSSRIGVPRYWLQAENVDFRDVQTHVTDPFTGQTAIDPVTLEPAVEHQYLTTSRNNFLFVGGVPVLYWPLMATDLQKPTYYIDSFRIRNDSVFGLQILPDLDAYQLFGLRDPPDGTKWTISPGYLSERGFALGTDFRYDRFGFAGLAGPVRGELDAWGLRDDGLDNLGRDRRAVTPDQPYRGRVLWQHRHYLANGFQLTGQVGWISDRNFLEQYYEREWDEQPDQLTGLELKRMDANSSWSIASSVRLNDFFTQTEWLPRLDHFLLGQSLFDRFTWSAHSHVGYAELKTVDPLIFAPPEPAQASLAWETDAAGGRYEQRSGVRAATRHELALPLPVGPAKVVPYVLGEAAYWGQDRNRSDARRLYGQAGLRGSLALWSVDPQVQSALWNLNGLAHKVVLDADFFLADADRDLDRFPLYDPLDDDATEHFRRRFRPAYLGRYTPDVLRQFDERYYALRTGMQNWVTAPSTEIADDLAVLRAGVRQRWQTKRGFPGQQRIIDWIVLDVEGSFFPNADRDNFSQDVGLVNYDFRWHIGDRFTLLSDGFADFFHDGLRTLSLGGRLSRPLRGNVYLGYRYIEGPFNSNILSASVNYRMSEKWILNAGGAVDFGPTGNIGESFTVTRIGESMLVRVGVSVDHSRGNVGLAFAIEPRFLPGSLGTIGGVPIPPVGAFGLE